MIIEDSLTRIVQDTRYAGPLPNLQYDILDSTMLLRTIQQTLEFKDVHQWQLARVLRYLEMRPIGSKSIENWQCNLWTCLPHQPIEHLVEIVRHRIKTNATELHMELVVPAPPGSAGPIEPIPRLTTYERDVLSMRMRPQGLRYPRPREIAAKLGGFPQQVNFALQRCRRVLGLRTMKDPKALRKAVRESGVLMEDPAFQ